VAPEVHSEEPLSGAQSPESSFVRGAAEYEPIVRLDEQIAGVARFARAGLLQPTTSATGMTTGSSSSAWLPAGGLRHAANRVRQERMLKPKPARGRKPEEWEAMSIDGFARPPTDRDGPC